jgi:hypothetical protein
VGKWVEETRSNDDERVETVTARGERRGARGEAKGE